MATATLTLSRLRSRPRSRARAHARRRFPVEGLLLFALSLAIYLTVANYLTFHVHYIINDAYARIDNAFNVLFTRDPHLAAIGFVWPPLPSFLDLPIIAFKGFWPALVTQGFAGSIEASIFSAGTVVLFNSGLKWAGVVRGMRWVFCLVWIANPMTMLYAAQGMAEAVFIFFVVASILVFVRWCESQRGALLPLMGILAGLGCLCRNEMLVLTFVMGIGVIVRSIRWKVSWREVETHALMFGLPAVLTIMMWLGSMAIIMHDPLYWIHAQSGGGGGGGGAPKVAGGGGGITVNEWGSAINVIIGHSIQLFPAVVAALAILSARIVLRRDRLTGLILIAFAFPIALLDIYLLKSSSLSPDLRYQIFVIPYTFVLFVYILRSLKSKHGVLSSIAALGMIGLLGMSNVASADLLGLPLAHQEQPVVTALATNQTMEQLGLPSTLDEGMALAPQVEKLNTDHGLTACDSTVCFPIVLNLKDPSRFVVTSDRNFQAVVGQPQVYGVEYFLVTNSPRDELNVIYPGLYDSGAGFAALVGNAGGYRLYRITGPTGRG
jgi:hypothetical protein